MSSRLLALGDSYTIGEAVPVSERWPLQLAEMAQTQGLMSAPVDVRIVAQTGWTVAELSDALDSIESELDIPWSLVTLLIGVNDQYRGHSLARYQSDFAQMLQRAAHWAGSPTRLRVLSIPDWGVTPFAREDHRSAAQIAATIDAFNAVAHEVCERWDVRFIDITDLTREAATDPTLLAEDGLHPSGRDYGRWAERVLQTLGN